MKFREKKKIRKENDTPLYHMNVNTKILNQIPVNLLQQHSKKDYTLKPIGIYPKNVKVVQHMKMDMPC